MVDYQEATGSVAEHTGDGRWFKVVGETASRHGRGMQH